METFQFPHFPSHSSVVRVALFSDVVNAPALKKRIVAASIASGVSGEQEREAVNFSFINAQLITSLLHLQTAISQAIIAETQGALRTKTVHSEILWALNPTNNISEAIKRYGVSDASAALFVVRVGDPGTPDEQILHAMAGCVNGRIVRISALRDLTDWSAIKKYHKLNNDVAVINARGDHRLEYDIIDNIVVSSVAMKCVMS
ncbi:kinase binding protein CGI-121-domain-containing protein [Infundibulicybe gibba]|nr:kinase binding protein CGI-121-domain-containing protein [Infundibulicybe gibba]